MKPKSPIDCRFFKMLGDYFLQSRSIKIFQDHSGNIASFANVAFLRSLKPKLFSI